MNDGLGKVPTSELVYYSMSKDSDFRESANEVLTTRLMDVYKMSIHDIGSFLIDEQRKIIARGEMEDFKQVQNDMISYAFEVLNNNCEIDVINSLTFSENASLFEVVSRFKSLYAMEVKKVSNKISVLSREISGMLKMNGENEVSDRAIQELSTLEKKRVELNSLLKKYQDMSIDLVLGLSSILGKKKDRSELSIQELSKLSSITLKEITNYSVGSSIKDNLGESLKQRKVG